MKTTAPIALIAAALALVLTAARAQSPDRGRIFFDAVTFAGDTDSLARVDLFVAVPYGVVSFERAADRFEAGYRVHLEVIEGSRRVFDTTIVRTSTTRSSEVATAQRPSYDFFQHRIRLRPGSYEARAEVIDPRTSFVASSRAALSVGRYSVAPLSLSGILLIDRIQEDSGGFVITPRITDAISADGEDYFAFFETYNAGAPMSVRLEAAYHLGDTVVGVPHAEVRSLPSGRSQQWLRLDAEDLSRGSYALVVRATREDDSTKALATTRRGIRIESAAGGMPGSVQELDDRITQLRYVAAQSDIDLIREATTYAERRRRYAEFWRRLDPTPGTPENEAMIEYFARIDYAKEHFRSYTAGWLTDQGRVYVVLGPPDNVSRDPFRSDGRRIETWQYYSRGNLQVAFEDDSGFGDYRLITPLSALEKYHYGK